ncbi:MAG TPA: hypothetical protein VES68_02045 [Candidatus Sulfotelmatobacter sp.]|nr:hypothetical protein [Candidatus Sulfotelmatobacter sp.]
MLALIILIVFGLGTAYFATQNTGLVHIILGNYLIQGVPLYVIVVGSILLGVFISWLVNIVDSFSSTRVIYGKDTALKKAHETIEELREETHSLEMENAHLKGELSGSSSQHHINNNLSENKDIMPSFLHRVKHSFG